MAYAEDVAEDEGLGREAVAPIEAWIRGKLAEATRERGKGLTKAVAAALDGAGIAAGMEVHKYYPANNPGLEPSRYVNRFFGHASVMA